MPRVKKAPSLSVSALSSFTDCEQKFHYSYVQKLKPNYEKQGARQVGSVVHYVLERMMLDYHQADYVEFLGWKERIHAHIEQWAWDNAPIFTTMVVDPATGEAVGASRQEAEWRSMLARSEEIAIRTIRFMNIPKNWRVFVDNDGNDWIEKKFDITIETKEGNAGFRGIIDAVLVDQRTGALVIVDYKVVQRFNDWAYYSIGKQFPTYQHIFQQMTGRQIDYSMVLQIRNGVAKSPPTLKDGSISRSKGIRADWDSYEKAIIEAGEDTRDYDDMYRFYNREGYWWETLRFKYNADTLNNFWVNTVKIVENIQQHISSGARPVMAMGFPCRNCSFRDLCLAKIYGDDVESLIGEEDEGTRFSRR